MEHEGQTVEELQGLLQRFGVYDYVVFASMLVICALIGLYYAIWGQKEMEDEDEYFMGGRNMQILPVSFSLVASFISGISLLGTPTEIYKFGTSYIFIYMGIVLMAVISSIFYLPVFHDLKLSSTYEYLERRFDKKTRYFGSVLFTLSLLKWLPIVIYVPALAFNQVTGVNVHIITPLVCIVCIFYTCTGGLKAVVWTDVIQTFIMFGAMVLVVIKGTIDIGGIETVISRNMDSGRIEFPSSSMDPFTRHTFLGLTIGSAVHWLPACVLNQNMIQRYLSLPSVSAVRWSLSLFIVGLFFILSTCAYAGLVIFATYFDCDPLKTKLAKQDDQLLPLLVMRVLGDYPGLPGVFVAGVFSAALSSLSTGLNSMSAVMLEDFIKPTCPNFAQKWKNWIMKGVVVIFGVICVAIVFLVEKLGAVLQLSMSLSGVANGPSLGIFTSGIFLPFVNGHGAFYGGFVGMLFSIILVAGNQAYISNGYVKYPKKYTTTEGCTYQYELIPTQTSPVVPPPDPSDGFPLFHFSYLWFVGLGALVSVIAAVIISLMTGNKDPETLDPNCLTPIIRRFYRKKAEANGRINEGFDMTAKVPGWDDNYNSTQKESVDVSSGEISQTKKMNGRRPVQTEEGV